MESAEQKESKKQPETYCPRCVGTQKSLELQRAGLSSRHCPQHLKQMQEEMDDYFKKTGR